MSKKLSGIYKTRSVLVCAAVLLVASVEVNAESSCRSGGQLAAEAYIHFNPIYALLFGSLDAYLSQNRGRFSSDSTAVRCAGELEQALRRASFATFDPDDLRRKREIDLELQKNGLGGGGGEMSLSTQLSLMADRMGRLARGLPKAAEGDPNALYTATTEMEQTIIFAEQLMVQFLQDPDMQAILLANKQLLQEAATIELSMLSDLARSLD